VADGDLDVLGSIVRACAQQPPMPQPCPRMRRTPSTRMEASAMSSAHRSGWIASWSRHGVPSVTIPLTSSGRRCARARANRPPRLCPTIATLHPWASDVRSSRAVSAAAVASEQSMLHVMPAWTGA
jgi:hypothetical protein